MEKSIVKINCSKIQNMEDFHDIFQKQFGFPQFYGRNLDAWIDCMTSIDRPEDGMSKVHCKKGKVFTIQLEKVNSFKNRCPKIFMDLIECIAFVNWRRIEVGKESVLALSFNE